MQSSNRLVSAFKTWKAARLIFRVGSKVEVCFEKDGLRDVWFPATIVEDLENGLFLVEYQCSGVNDDVEISRVTVDHHHVRPLTPQFKVASFVLLEKVDAFYDFGWWSGVITKKLADSNYIVYFKHTNRAKEFNHLELRPHVEWKDDEWFTPYQVPISDDVDNIDNGVTNCELNSLKCSTEVREKVSVHSINPIKERTLGSDKHTSIVTTTMKRSKPTSLAKKKKNIKSFKKLKSGSTSDDQSLSNTGQSKEVNDPPVDLSGHIQESVTGDKTIPKIKNLANGKKKPLKRGKRLALKRSMITSAKKEKLLVGDKGPEDIPKGDTNGTTTITTLDVVMENNVIKNFPFLPVVMGLPCNAMTVTRGKKLLQLPVENPPNSAEVQTPQSGVPLSPQTTGSQDEVADGVTKLKKKRGRPFKTQPKSPETSLAANNQNGDAIPLVDVDKVPNTSSGMELTLQQDKYKTVKGKRGKRRKISSISVESSPQDILDPLNQTANVSSEILVENSLVSMSDDQPLSRWFAGKQSSTGKKPSDRSKCPVLMANGNGQKLTFEKRSQLWGTLESMEVFRLIPQTPHFHPLDSLKESARERQAISYMVTFSGVFEDTFRLRSDHPRTEIEDHLETLSELESHGFDVSLIRNRLIELLLIKDKQGRLDTLSKEVLDKIQTESVEDQENDKEIELIDKQVNELLAKRDQCVKKKEKKESELAILEAELEGINEGMREARSRFDQLASASL